MHTPCQASCCASSLLRPHRFVSSAEFERLLKDAGQVDCPLLAALGYPVILSHTIPGRKCIPQVQVRAVSRNEHNNRFATVAASRVSTGLALGCVVGPVFALRQDGKDLSAAEWRVLEDVLMQLMDEYGEGPGHVTPQLLSEYRKQTRDNMRGRGLLKQPSGSGSGWHCLNCGEEEDEDTQLLRCSRCQTARYCSKDCQRAHWRAGHKHTCQPPEERSEARQAERLLETAVLREEQVIARNAAVPPLPASRADRALPPDVASALPRDLMSILDFNRRPGNKERFCPNCRTRYRLLPNPPATDRASKEQKLSGICSFACFNQMHPEGPNSGPDWFGQEAAPPDGAVQFMVDPHPDSIFY